MSIGHNASQVDVILRNDPAGIYSLMEPASQSYYCDVVNRIARGAIVSENEVAQAAVDLAYKSYSARNNDECRAHVGYYLIDDGRRELEEAVNYKADWKARSYTIIRRYPTTIYLGSVTVLTGLVVGVFDLYGVGMGASWPMIVWISLLAVIPGCEIAIVFLGLILKLEQIPLPKMDFARGVPDTHRTIVVVPAIFSSEAAVRELLETIEGHYLANQDEGISFALLGDWSDAPEERMPSDDSILDAAITGVRLLNARHQNGAYDSFYLFHRRRQWNQGESKWIGWERKRGKIREFNKLIRGANDTSFIISTADLSFLTKIQYVITLDAGTRLPCNTARRLIGAIAHPLNRPEVDSSTSDVRRGYVIIQPWPEGLPPCASRSRITRILLNYIYNDLESHDRSNIYQDLFREGIYLGKGLYDVDAFEKTLNDRFPENAVLSHDFIEGIYARTALATDVVIFEDRRLFYQSTAKRVHRWIRGDWQLLPWLMPYVRNAHGDLVRNILPAIARWKIIDPMLRSLFAPVMFLWFLAAWAGLPGSSVKWTLFILIYYVAYYALQSNVIKRNILSTREGILEIFLSLRMILLSMIILANQAYDCANAILRAVYRVFISRKRLLEWNPTTQVQQSSRLDLYAVFIFMRPTILVTLFAGAVVIICRPSSVYLAAPFLLSWLLSPLLVYWLAQNMINMSAKIEEEVELSIRLTGRSIWREIESSVYRHNHIILPETFQNCLISSDADLVTPADAARYPFWAVVAYEFGYISVVELADYLDWSLTKICERSNNNNSGNHEGIPAPKLPSWRRILNIENGNLAGHITLYQQICADAVNRPLFSENALKGLSDTISLLKREAAAVDTAQRAAMKCNIPQLIDEINRYEALLSGVSQKKTPETLSEWRDLFEALERQAAVINNRLNLLSLSNNNDLRYWAGCLLDQGEVFKSDLRIVAPYTFVSISNLSRFFSSSTLIAYHEWDLISESIERVPVLSQMQEEAMIALDELRILRSKIFQNVHSTDDNLASLLEELDSLAIAFEKSSRISKGLLQRYERIAQHSVEAMDIINCRTIFDGERRALLMNAQSLS